MEKMSKKNLSKKGLIGMLCLSFVMLVAPFLPAQASPACSEGGYHKFVTHYLTASFYESDNSSVHAKQVGEGDKVETGIMKTRVEHYYYECTKCHQGISDSVECSF
jgi:hypothetical protein